MAALGRKFSRTVGSFLNGGATAVRDKELSQLRRRLAATEAELSEARAELARTSFERDTPVFFIVGQSKSGTGWLMKIKDSHSKILCRGGGRFFGRHLRNDNFKEMQAGEAVRAKIQPSSLHYALLDAEYLRLWIERSVWSRDEDPERHLDSLTRLAINYFLTQKLAKSGKWLVGDKTPLFATDIVSETSAIYPGAKVIHLIRDGRDVAVSRMHQLWKTATDLGGISELRLEELKKRQAFYEDPQGFRVREYSLRSGSGVRPKSGG
jgi:Sulfotransferase family